mgnify:FL=1
MMHCDLRLALGIALFLAAGMQWVICLQQVPVSEVIALRKIYEDMNGAEWLQYEEGLPWNFSLSDADTHPCRPDETGSIWQRVLCTNRTDTGGGTVCSADNCTIVALDFHELNDLQGVVPNEIVYLESLRSLLFGYNVLADIDGGMPAIFGNLTTLTRLDLFNNDFNGHHIPEEYSKLVALEAFEVHECNISGQFPSVLASLEALKDLRLTDNPLCASIPDNIFEKLTDLTRLEMWDCSITGSQHHGFSANLASKSPQTGTVRSGI